MDERALALIELSDRRILRPGCYYEPTGRGEKVLGVFQNFDLGLKQTYEVIYRSGNGAGKTALGVNLADYIADPFPNPYFDKIPYLRNFKRPSKGRIYTTENAAKNKYPGERLRWNIRGRYTPRKDSHTYHSHFSYKNGSEYDIFTFDRAAIQSESQELDWAIVDEPMPYDHYMGLISRFRFGGFIFYPFTPLEGSGWYHDILETEERLNKDVFVVQGYTEDACIEHGVRGFLPHAYVEKIRQASLDDAEAKARLEGEYYSLSGRIYQNFGPDHVIQELTGWWADCYDKGDFSLYMAVDPHDKKAFAIGWYVVFPNNDIICVAEYPNFNFYREHSWEMSVEEYAQKIKKVEESIGKPADVRIIDWHFANAPKKGGSSVKADFMKCGLTFYDSNDSVEGRHMAVKQLLGRPKASNPDLIMRPKLYFMEHCINHRYSAGHYAWKQERGKLNIEIPTRVHADHMDAAGYMALSNPHYIGKPGEMPKTRIHRSKGGYHA